MTNVLLEKKGPYAVATIHRPEALNALNSQVLADLAELLDTVEADKEIRVLVITGAGEKAFVAGADIGEMSTLTKAEGEAFGKKGNDVFRRCVPVPSPHLPGFPSPDFWLRYGLFHRFLPLAFPFFEICRQRRTTERHFFKV